jgi:glucosamine-phosphate N-acetyltransferase
MNFILINKEINLKNYLNLLDQLSNTTNYDESKFFYFIDNLPTNTRIYLLYNEDKIVGSGTLLIENKIIHNFKNVGHIEDIVIEKNSRGNGYGKILINHLIDESKNFNCYKIILNCSKECNLFYQKFGFSSKNSEMSLYFKN